ncbi:DUF429 domain-containing protein [Microbacterium sp. 1P10UB]|uniref:DUF429 domain-containing protein n=1 Tax=unclassified Microbacterium TaxID=2609290 RepID=UPI0039A035E1
MTETPQRTGGVDLAAGAPGTALAVVAWSPGRARLESLELNADDERVVTATADLDLLGIDCAFGWPDEFVDFVAAHAAGDATPDGGIDWRRTLAYRETDRAVHAAIGRWPLSVSADRLGLTAMRCAGLLARLAAGGVRVDGSAEEGRVAEVYPGATLRLWGWDVRGYRVDVDVRRRLLARLAAEAPWLELGDHPELMTRSCDAFDAVIAALSARAALLRHYARPSAAQVDRARREGWVVLPTGPLADLVS